MTSSTSLTNNDTAKIAAIRAELPAVQTYAYLNTGTNGPLPRRSHDALVAQAQAELQEGRIGLHAFEQMFAVADETRASVAALLGCGTDEIALTHNTTEGMNIALMGIDWQPDDEIVTATLEHEGGLNPVALIKQRYGARVQYTDIARADCDSLAELERVLSPRTKAVVLSHVSWASGAVLPMKTIADMTHSVGALLICDAAQSCGMVPSNVYELGVDAYACSGQKWLCGPDGTGALFVHRAIQNQIQQTFIGYGGVKARMIHADTVFEPSEGARRYEALTLYPPSVKAFGTSLDWIADEVGWEWAYRRIHALGQHCYDALAQINGVTMYLPKNAVAGLVHFRLNDIAPADLTTRLAEQGVLIRHTPEPQLNRVSTGFYNTEEEIDRLAQAIDDVRGA